MIYIMEKYGIDVSDKCYAVGKICKTTDKKTGKQIEVLQSPSYCTTIESAIRALRHKLHMEAIKSFDGTLEEAVRKIQAMDEKIYAELKAVNLNV